MLLVQLVESALAEAQPGPVCFEQGEPEAWPGRQSGNFVSETTVLKLLGSTKSTGATKFIKMNVPILAWLGLGQLRSSLA